jgi:hypothetical protein
MPPEEKGVFTTGIISVTAGSPHPGILDPEPPSPVQAIAMFLAEMEDACSSHIW